MTDTRTLAAAIASQLDGTLVTDAPHNDCLWIDLHNEREGLRVALRRGYGAQSNRLTASTSYTAELRGNADYREMPDFHKLTTSAAITRDARTIAAQIETRCIQPALPLLDAWNAKRDALATAREQLEATVARWQARYPRARIDLPERETHNAAVHMTAATGAHVSGRLYADGSFYIDRISRIGEDAAHSLLAHLEFAA